MVKVGAIEVEPVLDGTILSTLPASKPLPEAGTQPWEGRDVPVAGSHFPGLQFGRLLPGEGVRRWTFDD